MRSWDHVCNLRMICCRLLGCWGTLSSTSASSLRPAWCAQTFLISGLFLSSLSLLAVVILFRSQASAWWAGFVLSNLSVAAVVVLLQPAALHMRNVEHVINLRIICCRCLGCWGTLSSISASSLRPAWCAQTFLSRLFLSSLSLLAVVILFRPQASAWWASLVLSSFSVAAVLSMLSI